MFHASLSGPLPRRFHFPAACLAAALGCSAWAAPARAGGVRCAARDFLGAYDTPGNAHAVSVIGDVAYVADYGSGLRIIDLSDCPPCAADLDLFDFLCFTNAFNAGC